MLAHPRRVAISDIPCNGQRDPLGMSHYLTPSVLDRGGILFGILNFASQSHSDNCLCCCRCRCCREHRGRRLTAKKWPISTLGPPPPSSFLLTNTSHDLMRVWEEQKQHNTTAWCKKNFPLFEIPASFLPSKMASPCTANWP